MNRDRLFALIGLAMFSACASSPEEAVAEPPCQSAQFSQFNFWVGEWEIEPMSGGPRTGRNVITREQGGCAILEHYTAYVGGGGATSISAYDPNRGVWRQTWASNSGRAVYLEGALRADGALELTDRGLPSRDPTGLINRVTWVAQPDGSVRQFWQTSRDDGATWAMVFDDRYIRAARAP